MDEMVDGRVASFCERCDGCVFGSGCLGNHPPLILHLHPGFYLQTHDFLQRAVDRLAKDTVCYFDEVMNTKEFIHRADF